jgi:hypothetical protein
MKKFIDSLIEMNLKMKLELILKIKSNKSQNRLISFYKFVVI